MGEARTDDASCLDQPGLEGKVCLLRAGLRLLLHIEDEELRCETAQVLRGADPPVPFEEHGGVLSDLLADIEKQRPDAVLLQLDALAWEVQAAIRQIRIQSPRTKVVALHRDADPNLILAAMRAGASEFLHTPLQPTLVPALERLLASSDGEFVPPARGKIIGLLSAKGGCGATALACHLGWELHRQTRKNVLLADLDLACGLMGFLMKSQATYSILDGIKNLPRLDESLWKALCVEHRPKLWVMPAPPACSLWDRPGDGQLRQMLQFTRTQHDWVVLDLGRGMNPFSLAAMDEIDQLFVVSTLDIGALYALKSIIHNMSHYGDKVQIVLNRTPRMMDVGAQEIAKVLGRDPYAALPNEALDLHESCAKGNLRDSNNHLAQHFAKLACKIAGIAPVKAKKRFALFG